jgi:predicted amidohydrolase YtcJ
LNSAGLARLGWPDHPDGTVRSTDPGWAVLQRTEPDLAAFSSRLAAYGVTGISDATPGLTAEDVTTLRAAQADGVIRQRLGVLAPGKRILHDDDLDLDALAAWIAERHKAGPVAVHCVTAPQLVVTLAALDAAGHHPRDRVEHAAVVPDAVLPDLARSGVTVVTQPNFVAERGDQYRADIPEAEHHELWRVASLRRAGVPVALSTDAPFGGSDPWATIRAAVGRTTPSGAVLGAAERVSASDALQMFLGDADRPTLPRHLVPGAPGDVCVLSVSREDALGSPSADTVAATVIAGRVVFVRE